MKESTPTSVLQEFFAARSLALIGAPLTYDVAPLGWSASRSRGEVASGARVMAIRIVNGSVLIGPLDEGDGPCGTCLDGRWWSRRTPEEQRRILEWQAIERSDDAAPKAPIFDDFALDAIWDLVCQMAGPDRRRSHAKGEGDTFLVDLHTHTITRHGVATDSQCRKCARPIEDSADAARIELSSRAKTHRDAYRQRPVGDVRLRESTYANPVCGVLGSHARRDHQHSCAAPVVGHLPAPGFTRALAITWSGHADSYQRSATTALLEGLERFSGLLPRRRAVGVFDTYRRLAADALNPFDCGSYEAGTYARPGTSLVPFTPDLKIHWVWGYSLTREQPVLVPEQLVYYNDVRHDDPAFVYEGSNGCATGSCVEEAILFALLELVERDAFLLTWFGQLALPQLDPRSSDDRELLFTLDRVTRAGYEPFLFDMRLDLGIPTVLAVVCRRTPGDGRLIFAAGCSLNPQDAIRAAMGEASTYVSGFADRVTSHRPLLEEMARDFTKITKLEHHQLVYGLPEMSRHADFLWKGPARCAPVVAYDAWERTRPQHLDLRADIDFCVQRLRQADLHEVIVVDQTSHEQAAVGLTTVRVIVPGLLPLDFGYDKRRHLSVPRTFTAPRRAGFRSADLDVADLNVAPHPFP